jgi:polysaccharide biosynthesis/export protein
MELNHLASIKSSGLAGALAWSLLSSAVQAQQASEAIAAPQPASTYRINSGDELEIYVWGEERLQRTVKVLPDGTIAFPLVGQIEAQGRLPQELEAIIRNGLEEQYRGQAPQVTVSVLSPSGIQFSVMGRVNGPGTFSPGRYVNVLEALSMAGGPNEFAKLDDIVIVRSEGGQLRPIRVQVSSLLKGNVNSQRISYDYLPRIETGDVIIVP